MYCVICCGWGGVWGVFFFFFFFFQAEDGIRDWSVTGVQTCALPIWLPEVTYQTLTVTASQWEVAAKSGGYQLSVLDKTQGLKVEIALSAEQMETLKQQ